MSLKNVAIHVHSPIFVICQPYRVNSKDRSSMFASSESDFRSRPENEIQNRANTTVLSFHWTWHFALNMLTREAVVL